MPELTQPVAPGGTVGILGGGQLGRMLCLAAARMGLKCVVLAPDHDSPAFQISGAHVVAAYDDRAALQRFAAQVDVITYEFENIPGDTGAFLSALKPVRPNPQALVTIQNRIAEKAFVQKLGVGTAPFAAVTSEETARAAFGAIGGPAVLKTSRLGYDGKGQRLVRSADDVVDGRARSDASSAFWKASSISSASSRSWRRAAQTARSRATTSSRIFTAIIFCARRWRPRRARSVCGPRPTQIAGKLLAAFDYVGVMAIELFETRDGRLLVNEMAPRVHNSGHWTIDGCTVSQFEQHLRAVCGWPLGEATRHSDAVMTNLLGDEVASWRTHAAQPATAVHLYGKTDARQGRKMGHVTRLYPLGTRPDG